MDTALIHEVTFTKSISKKKFMLRYVTCFLRKNEVQMLNLHLLKKHMEKNKTHLVESNAKHFLRKSFLNHTSNWRNTLPDNTTSVSQ